MEFSNVARPASGLRTASTTWPSRPSTCTDTLYPCALHVSMVARAIVVAMASDRSLWARSWAFAEVARPQASADATETPAIRNAILDMGYTSLVRAAAGAACPHNRLLSRICISFRWLRPVMVSVHGPDRAGGIVRLISFKRSGHILGIAVACRRSIPERPVRIARINRG